MSVDNLANRHFPVAGRQNRQPLSESAQLPRQQCFYIGIWDDILTISIRPETWTCPYIKR